MDRQGLKQSSALGGWLLAATAVAPKDEARIRYIGMRFSQASTGIRSVFDVAHRGQVMTDSATMRSLRGCCTRHVPISSASTLHRLAIKLRIGISF
jgi:hypothetical protein